MKFLLLLVLSSIVFSAPNQYIISEPKDEFVVLFKEEISSVADIVGNLFQEESFGSAKLLHEYSFGFAAKLNTQALERVQNMPEVELIEPNYVYSIHDVQENVPSWGLARVSQRLFTDKNTYTYQSSAGANVDVYVIDTGVYVNHSDFGGRATFGFNAVDDGQDFDGNGHGTHVSSTIAGELYGVAKKANIIAVRVLNEYGSGYLSDVVKGMDWALSNMRNTGRRSVANMSLGGRKSTLLDTAVARVIRAGLTIVVAAGNSHRDACLYSPASVDIAITVAATQLDDQLAYFSNHGSCVDILAPGHYIKGAWIGNENESNTISGTSMASPHVCGVVALYLGEEKSANVSPSIVKQKIIDLSTPNLVKTLPVGTPNLMVYNNHDASFGEVYF